MTQQVLIGLLAEGTTDLRFLSSVVRRTFERVAFDCWDTIEIVEIIPLKSFQKGFADQVLDVSKSGRERYDITVLCVHVDADDRTDKTVITHKIEPTLEILNADTQERCRHLAWLIPVYMQEAWMLADKSLLKKQIGTDKSDAELEIHRKPEEIANPKQVIEAAIRIARQSLPRRRRGELTIGDIYQSVGQTIELNSLAVLPSYQKFERNVRKIFQDLRLLQSFGKENPDQKKPHD